MFALSSLWTQPTLSLAIVSDRSTVTSKGIYMLVLNSSKQSVFVALVARLAKLSS